MRVLFSIIFSFILISSFSQEKQIKKVKKLYEKGKYEKCITKTKKYQKKFRKNADLQFFIVQSNIALYNDKSASKKIYQLKKTLRSWDKLLTYSKKAGQYSSLQTILKEIIYEQLNSPQLNNRNLDYLHVQLAEQLGDTTDYYRNKYLKEPNNIKLDPRPGPVLDTLFQLDSLRKILVHTARGVIGSPYKYGGTSSKGFDCSGFTQYLYKRIGIDLPHNAQLQSELGQIINLENAQSGDLIFFGERRASHAAMIFINSHGEAELIHCASRGVTHDTKEDTNHIHWMNQSYKIKKYIGFSEDSKNE